MSAPFDAFRTARWFRTINLLLQALLVLTLVGGLNYLARNHPVRFDLTRLRRFSLSPETLSYIRNLRQPVRIVVTQSADDNEAPELRGLLQEYKIATEANPNAQITVDYIDVYQDRRKAEELGLKQPGVIRLFSGDRSRALTVNELYKTRRIEDKSTNLPGATTLERTHFQGEQALTGAVLDVSSPDRKKIYFLSGHGELDPGSTDPARGLSDVRDQLRLRNFDVDTLDLAAARQVPLDASLLIITRPQSRYRPAEQELLREYLGARAGRLLLFLEPGLEVGALGLGLDELLFDDWGIIVDDDLIWDTGSNNITEDGELLLYSFQDHPVTKALITSNTPLRLGLARSVHPNPARSVGNGLTTVTLAATSPGAWGEKEYRKVPFAYNPGIDFRPLPGLEPKDRLGVIVAAEKTAVRPGLAFSVRGGRVVAFGTGDLIANQRIADAGNQTVFISAVNWAVDRDTQLNIPARPIERFQLALSAGELARLRYALLFALPGLSAFLGIIVYWTRRH